MDDSTLINSQTEINMIVNQLFANYTSSKIILFGSQVKGTATKRNDIDICIVKNTVNKRELLKDIYLNVDDSSKPFDVIIYADAE